MKKILAVFMALFFCVSPCIVHAETIVDTEFDIELIYNTTEEQVRRVLNEMAKNETYQFNLTKSTVYCTYASGLYSFVVFPDGIEIREGTLNNRKILYSDTNPWSWKAYNNSIRFDEISTHKLYNSDRAGVQFNTANTTFQMGVINFSNTGLPQGINTTNMTACFIAKPKAIHLTPLDETFPADIDVIGFYNWLHSLDGGGNFLNLKNTNDSYNIVDNTSFLYILEYFNKYGGNSGGFVEFRAPLDSVSTHNTEQDAMRLFRSLWTAYDNYIKWKKSNTTPVPVVPVNPTDYDTDITVTDNDDIYTILLRQLILVNGNQLNLLDVTNTNLVYTNGLINQLLNAVVTLDADIIAGFAKLDATFNLKLGDLNTTLGDINTSIQDGNTDINNTLTNIETNTSTGGGSVPDIDYTDKGDFEITPIEEIDTELSAPAPDTDIVFVDIEDYVKLMGGGFYAALELFDGVGVKSTLLCGVFVCFLINKLRGF